VALAPPPRIAPDDREVRLRLAVSSRHDGLDADSKAGRQVSAQGFIRELDGDVVLWVVNHLPHDPAVQQLHAIVLAEDALPT
jgi:hypothetical protein